MAIATASRNGKTAPPVEDSEQTITIAPLKIHRIPVTIRGTQPLITNKFSNEAERKLEESQSGERIKAPKQARLPEAEFKGARYLIEDHDDVAKDVCGFPAAGIKKAMVNAGGRVSDAKMTWLRAILNVEADSNGLVRIISPEPPMMRTDHVVQMGRGNLRYRPQFWPWSMNLNITYNADHVRAQDIVNLLQQAGFSIGIGDWRPEKSGTFGTFEVVGSVSD